MSQHISPERNSTQREILFNAFDMNCVVHQSPGLWRHPEDRAREYNTLKYWTDVAQTLERGLFDGLFIADVLGPYDVFGSTPDAALRSGAQIPLQDPFLLVAAMAAVTEHLGFGVTAGTAYEHPYPFSRRLGTLDHLTGGRMGWNVVTGYLPSAAQNMGQDDQMEHDARYDYADEYLEVVYKLLEGSWEDDAVVADKESGVFTDPAKVHRIEHHGEYFKTPGIGVVEPSPQRTPVIYQAGASARGRAFAGKHAEAVFINPPTKELAAEAVRNIRQTTADAGRDPYSVRVFAMQTVVTGPSEEDAQAKYDDLTRYVDPEGSLVLMSGWMGIDLSQFDLDKPIGDVESNAIQSTVETFKKASGREDEVWTVRQLAEWVGVGGFGPVIVGDGPSAAAQLAQWQDETDVDGFNLAYHVTPGTFEDIVEYVVPELQRLGRYKTEYSRGTMRGRSSSAAATTCPQSTTGPSSSCARERQSEHQSHPKGHPTAIAAGYGLQRPRPRRHIRPAAPRPHCTPSAGFLVEWRYCRGVSATNPAVSLEVAGLGLAGRVGTGCSTLWL